ncbi:MAG: glycosyltransferase, partial [Verrucomicrobiota bacterium]
EDIPVHFIAAPDRLRLLTGFYFDSRRIGRRIKRFQPDLIHAHGTEDAYTLVALRSGKPFVVTLQGVMFVINQRLKPRGLDRMRCMQVVERYCLRRTRHAVAKSRYIGDEVGRAFPHLTLHEIPNTFDPAILGTADAPREQSLIFVGTVYPRKGVHILREGFARLKKDWPDLTLWIVGNTENPAPYESEQLGLLKEQWGDDVVLHGQMTAGALFDLMARATALVAPSLEEMFGNQVIESLLLDTPAVVSDDTAMAENVRRFGHGAVFPQQDPEGLAEAVRPFLEQVDETERDASKEKVIRTLGPETVAGKHLEVYETVLRGR